MSPREPVHGSPYSHRIAPHPTSTFLLAHSPLPYPSFDLSCGLRRCGLGVCIPSRACYATLFLLHSPGLHQDSMHAILPLHAEYGRRHLAFGFWRAGTKPLHRFSIRVLFSLELSLDSLYRASDITGPTRMNPKVICRRPTLALLVFSQSDVRHLGCQGGNPWHRWWQ